MAVNKIKRTKAMGALRKAGMSPEMARTCVKLLDLDEAFGPQIAALVEEDPELFGLDENGEPFEAEDDVEDDKPMTAREKQIAMLRGEHLERRAFRRGAQERPSTASAAAQEAAAHLRKGINTSAPVIPRRTEPGPRIPLPAPVKSGAASRKNAEILRRSVYSTDK